MSNKTNIEWTERTWNPVVGCDKVTSGCKNCYAEAMAKRLQAMGAKGYENGFKVTLLPERLNQPKKVKSPSMYFVCSMSDLFHKDVPASFIEDVMVVIESCPHHTFQLLTKRPHRMAAFFANRPVPENVWCGTTVENKKQGVPRVDVLRQVPAKVRFLSCEPLLEGLGTFGLDGIHWVIAGGESGSNARPMKKEWVTELRDLCEKTKTPFFFKQWGAYGEDGVKRPKKENGKKLDGVAITVMPVTG